MAHRQLIGLCSGSVVSRHTHLFPVRIHLMLATGEAEAKALHERVKIVGFAMAFSARAAQRVSRQPWHPDRRARWLDGGRFRLVVASSGPSELEMDISRQADQLSTIADTRSVKTIVRRRAQHATDLHWAARQRDGRWVHSRLTNRLPTTRILAMSTANCADPYESRPRF